ncbi:PilZ domain-containing protein [Pseudoduganella albidiflava]|uniref:PilZ domain-containing protein n=1 Tax=Pseudoduganella albidiflava TaxID=321983 RepID=UPI0013F1781D|nr:PilZ domain-containing protein [Pseudoduganella albidiflava]
MSEQITEQRRAHVRRLLQVEASLSNDNRSRTWRVHLTDIARMGVGFVAAEPLTDCVHGVLRFRFPDSTVTDEVHIRIVHCRAIGAAGRVQCGARIHTMSDACVERIMEYVTRGESTMPPAPRSADGSR